MKRIKLWIELHSDDLKGFFLKFLPLIGIVILVRFLPNIIREVSSIKYDTNAIGEIIEIETIKGIHDSEVGGKVITKGYEIEYEFSVDTFKIRKREFVTLNSLDMDEKVKAKKLGIGDAILIGFAASNPTCSRIKRTKAID